MKKLNWLFILGLFLFPVPGYSQDDTSSVFVQLFRLQQKKEFGKLMKAIDSIGNPSITRMFAPFTLARSGNFSLSNKLIDSILKVANNRENILALHELRITNYVNSYDYAAAGKAVESCLELPVDKEERESLENMQLILNSISAVPPQSCYFKDSVILEGKKDLAGLLRIPVSVNGSTNNFIFDTGANFSVISESNASTSGIEILGSGIAVKAVTGNSVNAKIGIAKDLVLGQVSYKNVVFLIFPDNALSIKGGIYKIPGIIGQPVIRQMEKITVNRNGQICAVHGRKQADVITNLHIDGHNLGVDVFLKDSLHTFFFDFGARSTILNSPAIASFNLSELASSDKEVWGVGGKISTPVYTINDIDLRIEDQIIAFKKVKIKSDSIGNSSSKFFGILGSDILGKCRQVTLDFTNCRFSVSQ